MSSPLPPLAPPARRVTWLDLLVVFALTAAAFAPVLRTGFAPLDDGLMLSENANMRRPTWETLKLFWSTAPWHIYMPLAETVWQGVALFSWQPAARGDEHLLLPVGFKVASVLAHAASAAAAAWTLSRLTDTRWPAVAGALLFALHPLQVESVAWTTGLKDVLCGLFACVSIGAYAGFARRDPPTHWTDAEWWAAFAGATLAMLSKPTGMMLPLVLIAADWALRPVPFKRRIDALAPFALPALACALVIQAVQGNTAVARMALPLRPLIAADSYAFYLRKLVWPLPLSVDYGRRPGVVVAAGAVWWTWAVPAAVLAALAWARSRKLWLAAALFVVPVLPVSGLLAFDMQQYSTVTDHYAYQPLLGAGLAVALGLGALTAARWRTLAAAMAALVLVTSGVVSHRVSRDWISGERLYRMILSRNPDSWLALNMLANLSNARGDLFTSGRLAAQALRLSPEDGNALDALTERELLLGNYPAAVNLGRQAIRQTGLPRATSGKRVAQLGAKLGDRDLAEAGVRHWLLAEPDNKYAHAMLEAIVASKRQAAATRQAGTP